MKTFFSFFQLPLAAFAAALAAAFLTPGLRAAPHHFIYSSNPGNASVTITGYTGPGGEVTIPAEIEGLPVTEIGFLAFQFNLTITRVSIPEPVAVIGSSAFEGCFNLVAVDLPASITTVGRSAFAFCTSLTVIRIPEGVAHLSENVFLGCTSLVKVWLPSGLLTIGAGAFEQCISLPSLSLPRHLVSIEADAFADTLLLDVIRFLGDSPQVGLNAFADAGVETARGEVEIAYYADRSGFGGTVWQDFQVRELLEPGLAFFPLSGDYTQTRARVTAEVLNVGGGPVTERGFLVALASVNPDPMPGGVGVTTVSASGGSGSFSIDLSGLSPDTVYSFRAYAVNFFGTGFSEVSLFETATAFAFENWMSQFTFLPGANLTRAGDAVGDKLANLLEFAFGTNPSTSSTGFIQFANGVVAAPGRPALLLQNIPGGVNFKAVYGRRKDYRAAGLVYTVQFSADLQSWQATTAEPEVLAVGAEIDAVGVPYPFSVVTPRGIEKASFFRVVVTEVP